MQNAKLKIENEIKQKKGENRHDAIIRCLLENRGLKTKKQIKEFLKPSLSPASLFSLVNKNQLEKAVKRIKKAIENKEKIIIFGDYDADGICGTAILWETLYHLGADVLPYIPDRETEGYGFSRKSLNNILSQTATVSLIITVDNGIVAHKAVDDAKKKGIAVIVTDHHQKNVKCQMSNVKCQNQNSELSKSKKQKNTKYDLPDAEAIVWTDELSGSGVAWILAEAIKKSGIFSKAAALQNIPFFDLAAVGTVADLVPLLGVNRALVKEGLKEINRQRIKWQDNIKNEKSKIKNWKRRLSGIRPGLIALMEAAGILEREIGVYEIGFMIAPRLNAMGRMAHSLDALRMLCIRHAEKAQKLAELLDKTNRQRQKLMEETTFHARQIWLEKDKGKQAKLIFVEDESYQQGVIGLVAGKLVDEFHRPAIVISKGENLSKASARSINGFNIIEAIRTCNHFIMEAGGHPMAAGFTVETKHLRVLEKKLSNIAEREINKEKLIKTLTVDCELEFSDLSFNLYERIRCFEPFGVGNPQPVFLSRQVRVVSKRLVGREEKHLKLRLDDPQTPVIEKIPAEAIGFNLGHLATKVHPGDLVDIVYTISQDDWNNQRKLQLKIKDIGNF